MEVALPGITPERTMQIVGGGVVADEIMKALPEYIQESRRRSAPVGAAWESARDLRWLDSLNSNRTASVSVL